MAMTAEEEREKLLWQAVFEREYCRSWWKTPQQDSGQPASSLKANARYAAAKVAGAPNRKQEETWQR